MKIDYNYYLTPVTYVTTWNLGSIPSSATGTTVNFLYNNGEWLIREKNTAIPTDRGKGNRAGKLEAPGIYWLEDLDVT